MLMARRTPARINRRATIGPVQVITTWGICIMHTVFLFKQVDIGMLCVPDKHGKGQYGVLLTLVSLDLAALTYAACPLAILPSSKRRTPSLSLGSRPVFLRVSSASSLGFRE